MTKEELMIAGRAKELAGMCYHKNIPLYSDFLNLNEQSVVWQTMTQLPPVSVKAVGGFDVYGQEINCCERKMFAFLPKDRETDLTLMPIEVVEISPVAAKFAEVLTHRDFLGALLNLGIERSLIGDIFVCDNVAYVICHRRIADFICSQLTRVRHTVVNTTLGAIVADAVIKTAAITSTVASVRLDSMICSAFNLSRSSAIPLIEEAKCFVNGKLITTNSYTPKAGDIISVRGMGKFVFDSESGVSKKGRIVINLRKYI
ncbi:MAG: YlmH/Sll1252 family protein [Lachnospiraceae bacterium]